MITNNSLCRHSLYWGLANLSLLMHPGDLTKYFRHEPISCLSPCYWVVWTKHFVRTTQGRLACTQQAFLATYFVNGVPVSDVLGRTLRCTNTAGARVMLPQVTAMQQVCTRSCHLIWSPESIGAIRPICWPGEKLKVLKPTAHGCTSFVWHNNPLPSSRVVFITLWQREERGRACFLQ